MCAMRVQRIIATATIVAAVAAGLATLSARRGGAPRRVEWPVMGTVAGLAFRGGDAAAQDAARHAPGRPPGASADELVKEHIQQSSKKPVLRSTLKWVHFSRRRCITQY